MEIRRYCVLALLPFALTACGGGDGEMEEVPEVVVDTTDPAAGMGMDTAGAMAATGATVAMQPVGNSGVSGEAMLMPMGSQTQVMVRITGAQQGGNSGHIHQGTCDSIGSVVVPLQEITAGSDGTGTSTSTVDVDEMTVMDGQHLIAFHAAGGDPGSPVVCGNIPMHQM